MTTVKRIRRVSDGKWLGLNIGIQEKWLVSRSGAFGFMDTDLRFEPELRKLREENPGEEFEVKEGKP
jgi:hypothetical protein